MKKKTHGCDYLKSRNENLRREVLARLGNSRRVKDIMKEVAREAAADRFYISEERALLLLRRYRMEAPVKGEDWGGKMLPGRKKMIQDIDIRVRFLMARRPDLPLKEAVFRVVNSPAPGFYLTPKSVKTLFYA